MKCFARGLGFPDDFFIRAHDISRPDSQTCCRLLHYYAVPQSADTSSWVRAGAHTDWDLLTLLFQREGQSGLEICPGREAVTEFAIGDEWTKVELKAGDIICNIGDLMMSWSDDRFKSTFHRVKVSAYCSQYQSQS
jgi:isopenicillin N synthase-like dioxygenase